MNSLIHDITLSGNVGAFQEVDIVTPWQQSVNVNIHRVSMEEPVAEYLGTLSRASSMCSPPKPFQLATKPGLAPFGALDQLSFEPVNMVCSVEYFLSYLIDPTAGAYSQASGNTLQRIQYLPSSKTILAGC